MTTKSPGELSCSLSSCTSPSYNDVSSDKLCWLFRLSSEVFQMITDFLSTRDLEALSETCQKFYVFFNANQFWIRRIHYQFPRSIAELYTRDLFEKPETIPTYNQIQPSGLAHDRAESQLNALAINSTAHYNDEAIKNRHAKMYVSKEEFLTALEFYQFSKPSNYSEIPFMKLIFFYLIDRKRCAAVDMSVIHRNDRHLIENSDENSLTGRIIHLRSVCWLEITGQFEHKIMPGKYEVSWRMKTTPNCTRISGETEFIVVPQHGKLLDYKMTEDSFQSLLLEHADRWFVLKMGETIIYEPSTVLMAIYNWNDGHWKYGLSWDYIELTLVP